MRLSNFQKVTQLECSGVLDQNSGQSDSKSPSLSTISSCLLREKKKKRAVENLQPSFHPIIYNFLPKSNIGLISGITKHLNFPMCVLSKQFIKI